MHKKDDSAGGERINDIRVQTENIAFDAAEMIACAKCGRSNPPNRVKCLYCAAELELSKDSLAGSAPVLRKLENWEKGFNVVFLPGGRKVDDAGVAEISRILSTERETICEIVYGSSALPLARVESEMAAEIVDGICRRLGIETVVVPDRALAEDVAPKRLRSVSFDGDEMKVTLFNTGETETVKNSALALIVTGAVFEQKTESIEKRKKKESKTLEEWETASDESLVDIYTRSDPAGWRVPAKGFDFSCLGNEKGMLAGENIRRLVARLREFAPGLVFVDAYLADRKALGHIWEIERKNDFQGFRRSGFGKSDLGKVSSSNNLAQFTKYSRLQWHLL